MANPTERSHLRMALEYVPRTLGKSIGADAIIRSRRAHASLGETIKNWAGEVMYPGITRSYLDHQYGFESSIRGKPIQNIYVESGISGATVDALQITGVAAIALSLMNPIGLAAKIPLNFIENVLLDMCRGISRAFDYESDLYSLPPRRR